MAPVDAIDWVVMLLAMAWSLYFLLSNLWSVISEHLSKEKMLPVLAFIRYACGWLDCRHLRLCLMAVFVVWLSATHLLWVVMMKLLFF